MLIIALFIGANSQTIIYGDGSYPRWLSPRFPFTDSSGIYIRYN